MKFEIVVFFNATIDYNYAGLKLDTCKNGTVIDSVGYDSFYSFDIVSCEGIILNNNTFRNSTYGLRVNGATTIEIFNGTVEDCSESGIRIESSECIVHDNNFNKNYIAISLSHADYNDIFNNYITNSSQYGISTRYGNYNRFNDNILIDNAYIGFELVVEENAVLTNNHLSNSEDRDFYIYASEDCLIFNNTLLSSQYQVYIHESNNITIKENIGTYADLGSVKIFDTSNVFILNNTFKDTYMGRFIEIDTSNNLSIHGNLLANTTNFPIDLDSCSNINLTDNIITEKSYGTYMNHCTDFWFENNTIFDILNWGAEFHNTENGSILFNQLIGTNGFKLDEGSSNLTIFGNNFTQNSYGIDIIAGNHSVSGNLFLENIIGIKAEIGSESCIIYNNNFIDNMNSAHDDGTDNAWDLNGVGNFWSDYTGIDENEDGVGDIAYSNAYLVIDNFPQLNPDTAPIIAISPNVVCYYGELGHSISWKINDVGVTKGSFILLQNTLLIQSGYWNQGMNISISVDGFSQGEYEYQLFLWDYTAWNSHTTAHIEVSIQNNLPLLENVTLTPESPHSDDDLFLSYDYWDYEASLEITEIRWYQNSLLRVDLNDLTTIDSTELFPGDLWNYTIRTSDGENYSEMIQNYVIIENYVPIIDNLTITPESPYATDSLSLNFDYFDQDGTVITNFEIFWYTNGILQVTLINSTTVESSYLIPGDEWNVTVRCFDTLNYSNRLTSIIIIGNHQPIIGNLSINPAVVRSLDNLVIEFDYFDSDATDMVFQKITWYKNGILQPLLSNRTVIEKNYLTHMDVWNVTLQASDGLSWSNTLSKQTTILNYLPTVAQININLTISLVRYSNTGGLSLTYEYNDLDGDSEHNSSIVWFRNGTHLSVYDNMTKIPFSEISEGDVWKVSIIPYDGLDFGMTYESEEFTIILNTIGVYQILGASGIVAGYIAFSALVIILAIKKKK